MSAAADLDLLALIAQVEIAWYTRVLVLNDFPAGLDGFYAPALNHIGLCRKPQPQQRCCPPRHAAT
ncbi:MAG: hypothetical protein RAK21_09340 [Synechococcus sp. SP2 MAG]|nr:hypothetical protein [Synechococcus sp. SP2 MAG]